MPDRPLTRPVVTPGQLAQAMTYPQYRSLVNQLLATGKTTGTHQDPKLVQYTELNAQRMSRLDKTTVLKESLVQELKNVSGPWTWLVLTEGWCGDAAQNIPVLAKMAEVSPQIELKLLLRDENLELMDQYLTDGSRSIPKLICLKTDTIEEAGHWGPRPAAAQQLVLDYKANPQGMSHDEFIATVHAWYAKDKTQSLQLEFEPLLKTWNQQ